MAMSGRFNRMFHSYLSDILKSGGKIFYIDGEFFSASIDLQRSSLEQLKKFLKYSDTRYPRARPMEIGKPVFSEKEEGKLSLFFGPPTSITNLSNGDMVEHLSWIKKRVKENNIDIQDEQFNMLLKRAEMEGY